MRNRYYDPATGQFTQPDPIGIAGGLNVYGFAAGDPVSFGDPYGLSPCSARDDWASCPLDLGNGYRGRVDHFEQGGVTKHEIHVYRVSRNGTSAEVGVFGREGWQARHGFDGSDPGVPRNVLNRINGVNVRELRRTGVLRQGEPVRGGAYHPRVQALFRRVNSLSVVGDVLGALEADAEAKRLNVSVWRYMTAKLLGATAEEIAEASCQPPRCTE
jgi:uncharacterized protein RhaS with RHS repeats